MSNLLIHVQLGIMLILNLKYEVQFLCTLIDINFCVYLQHPLSKNT